MARRSHHQASRPQRDMNVVFTRRSLMLSGASVAAMGVIGARLIQLQATDLFSGQYTSAAEENRYDTRILAPPRGIIHDRFGVALAQTSRDYRISIARERASDLEGVIRSVADILELDAAWVQRKLREVRAEARSANVVLRQGLTWGQFSALNVRLPELPGVICEAGAVRRYPFDVVYAHPIGYVQRPSQRDLDREISTGNERRAVYLRDPNVRVGKAGLERGLEPVLHGEAGWRRVEVNAFGRVVSESGHESREPRAGPAVVLGIDHELQRLAVERLGAESGAALVMDVRNGDLLVMASTPGFDPNRFVNGIPSAEFRVLNEDEKKPLFHKAVQGAYAPGSTFKMMVGIAAKQAGVEDDWHVNCPGYFPFGGRNFHCWARGGHGSVNLHDAIKYSCDVYFYQAALRAGPERIAAVARAFGFGEAFDVDVPNVEDGIVPDPAWWRRRGRGEWTGGLTLNYGIGQGDLLVTPLQLVTMAARIANNGRAVRPRLVREAPGRAASPRPPAIAGIDPSHLARVRDGMYGVCNEPGGTALRAGALGLVHAPDGRIVEAGPDTRGFPPVQIAGKTGTAQVRVITAAERASGVRSNASLPWRLRDNALFVCFGPWNDPRYACAVVVEHGGGGSAVAGPIASAIMRQALLRDPVRRPAAALAQLDPRTAPQGAAT